MNVTPNLGLPIPQMSDTVGKTITDLASAMQAIDTKLWEAQIVEHNLDAAEAPNGRYVRWINGLQVCWRNASVYVNTLNKQTFAMPAKFAVLGAVTLSGDTDAGTAEIREVMGTASVSGSSTKWTVRMSKTFDWSDPRVTQLFAIGIGSAGE